MDKPLREQFPRREQSPDELELLRQDAERKKREKVNKKIRCPACKKNQYFDNYFANPNLGVLVCPKCGVCFMDPAKLKIISKTVAQANAQVLKK